MLVFQGNYILEVYSLAGGHLMFPDVHLSTESSVWTSVITALHVFHLTKGNKMLPLKFLPTCNMFQSSWFLLSASSQPFSST